MSATVYTSGSGRRFHEDRECRAFRAGQDLSDQDCGCYEFCYHRLPTTHLPRKRTPENATSAGYTACRVCVPPALALPVTGETYGHEPVNGTGWFGRGERVCARCTEPSPWWSGRSRRIASAHWPCMSAVVLGLVIADAGRWNARYSVGTAVTAYPLTRVDEPLLTRTRTPAWRLGHGASVVAVDGYPGGIALTHIDPRSGA